MSTPDASAWSAIVLTGGTGRRLGGRSKADLPVDGVAAFDRLISSLPHDVDLFVAGPERPAPAGIRFRQESPPHGGPVAGIAATLDEVTTPVVAILATDVPWAGPLVRRLVSLMDESDVDAVIPVSPDGRRQLLCSAWRTPALRQALLKLGDPRDRAVRDLLAHVSVLDVPLTPAEMPDALDIDTPADLERAQRRTAGPTVGNNPDAV